MNNKQNRFCTLADQMTVDIVALILAAVFGVIIGTMVNIAVYLPGNFWQILFAGLFVAGQGTYLGRKWIGKIKAKEQEGLKREPIEN